MMSTSNNAVGVAERFRPNLYAWVAVRHFLPANSLRELLFAVVDEVSDKQLSLDQLFEERPIDALPGLEGWILRSRRTEGRLAGYLQRFVQGIVWQADNQGFPPGDGASPEQIRKANSLDQALELGMQDFDLDERNFRELPNDSALVALFELLRQGAVCRSGDNDWETFAANASARLEGIEPVLALVILKHLGDLSADADEWLPAQVFYHKCRDGLIKGSLTGWEVIASHLLDLVDQSIAAAERMIKGPQAAEALLRRSLGSGSLDDRPVLNLNAPFDAFAAALTSDPLSPQFFDDRTALLRPPLIHDSHDLDSAIYSQAAENFGSAGRRCWAVLRRQMALGLSTESRGTRGVFARVLLEMLNRQELSRSKPGDFLLAVRLLLQSADRSGVGNFIWSDKLVANFVDERAVKLAIATSEKHEGAALERQQTVISLFESWTAKLPQEHRFLAKVMIDFIARRAEIGQSSTFSNRDLGTRGIEALAILSQSRPELCRDSAGAIHNAILARLRPGIHWNLQAKSLELAANTLGIFHLDQTRELAQATLAVLNSIGPQAQLWPVFRPALRILVADEVIALANSESQLGQAVVNAIVTFSAEGRAEAFGLMYYLERFNSSLLESTSASQVTASIVQRLITAVQKTNSSSTVEEIRALLAVPALSGEVGLRSALEALNEVLTSANSDRPSIGLPQVYAAILALAGRRSEFAKVLGETDVAANWKAILGKIYAVWSAATKRPRILAPFSIPEPIRPNRTIVHNWAYASLRFAKDQGEEGQMLDFLRSIDPATALREPIELAIATGALSAEVEASRGDNLEAESDDTFYCGLGRRLVRVLTGEGSDARQLCKALLEQCLKRGPRGLDAGVLVEAHRLGAAKEINRDLIHDYMQRAENDSHLRLALWPLIAGIT